jgi:hypothetical protein
MNERPRMLNSQKEDAHHGVCIEFAARRAHGNNMDVRCDFFLVYISRNAPRGSNEMI